MKKVLFVAGIAVIGFSAAFAQDIKQSTKPTTSSSEVKQSRVTDGAAMRKADPQTIAQRKTERLNRELSFTEDQKQKVHAVFLKEIQETNGRAALRKETEDQLKAIFTAEQNQKYEAMKESRQQAIMENTTPSRAADLKTAPGIAK
jgi:opacity protein-like surface antigen